MGKGRIHKVDHDSERIHRVDHPPEGVKVRHIWWFMIQRINKDT